MAVVSYLCADLDKNKAYYLQEALDVINDFRSTTNAMAISQIRK